MAIKNHTEVQTDTTYEQGERGSWTRWEGHQHVHCVSKSDKSPRFSGYALTCGMCWLGGPHTEDYHARDIAE